MTELLEFLGRSPSPYHAAESAASVLSEAGFRRQSIGEPLDASVGGGFVVRGGAIVAWHVPSDPAPGFVVIGAHTDSPNLRVKPHPDVGSAGYRQIGVDVYGGALVNSWLDRDLGLSGRVALRSGEVRLVEVARPVLRLSQLAIHLDRDVNERGVVLDRQQHVVPIWGLGQPEEGGFARFLAKELGVSVDDVVAWDVMTHDLAAPAVLGVDGELIASGRLDNLVSVWCGATALARMESNRIAVLACFDHEEVGSETSTGAASPLLADTLERITAARGGSRSDHLAAISTSLCVSADMAHAVHPSYPDRYEPSHLVHPNRGPVIKTNVGQRYATDAATAAEFASACDRAGVPWQVYSHRSNMACGSTIGPITAMRLGIATVDVGNPMLSMHSAREMAGRDDAGYMVEAMTEVLRGA
ncbi:MAG TPA: M18 family aminopeptidase [Acidimicrobiales bacterium]|nr:M18 family aminopeptidase [Acidimicrobiales bacterium]